MMLLSAAVRRRGLAAAALTTVLALSACGGGDSPTADHGMTMPPSSAPAGAGTGTAVFNDADVTFTQMMIEHHQQAIEMASLAEGRAAGTAVKDLAAKIKAAQQPEIDTMTGWLTAWGKTAPMPGMGHSSTPGTSKPGTSKPGMSMPGMMSDADMTKLANAKGAAFDKQFLTMMIGHHEGAIEMARQESTQGSNPDTVTLAKKIITDQQAEITTMKGMLTAV